MCNSSVERQVIDSFIVFEGLDGAGTTTQARRLVSFLGEQKISAVFTYEPSEFLPGKTIRLLLNKEEPVHPATMAFLYAADRNEHLYRKETGVLSLLDAGNTVVSDRYLFSSLAYQGSQNDRELVEYLNSSFPLPRHLVYLDVPPALAEKRRVKRGAGDMYENLPFQTEVSRTYESVLQGFEGVGMSIHVIDGSQDPESVFLSICTALGL